MPGITPQNLPKTTRKITGEGFRKSGFWAQLVLLLLVDWATVYAFLRQPVPWYHYAGFVVVNVVLLGLTVLMWRWLKPLASPYLPPPSARSLH